MRSSFTPGMLSCLYQNSKDDLWYDEFTDEPAEGIYRNHFDNHKVEEETYFEGGIETGPHKIWWPDGSLRRETNLSQGLLNGASTHWHFGGQMASRSHWVAGEHHGTHETWWENGQLECRQEWKNGELLEETYFREDGTEI